MNIDDHIRKLDGLISHLRENVRRAELHRIGAGTSQTMIHCRDEDEESVERQRAAEHLNTANVRLEIARHALYIAETLRVDLLNASENLP